MLCVWPRSGCQGRLRCINLLESEVFCGSARTKLWSRNSQKSLVLAKKEKSDCGREIGKVYEATETNTNGVRAPKEFYKTSYNLLWTQVI